MDLSHSMALFVCFHLASSLSLFWLDMVVCVFHSYAGVYGVDVVVCHCFVPYDVHNIQSYSFYDYHYQTICTYTTLHKHNIYRKHTVGISV